MTVQMRELDIGNDRTIRMTIDGNGMFHYKGPSFGWSLSLINWDRDHTKFGRYTLLERIATFLYMDMPRTDLYMIANVLVEVFLTEFKPVFIHPHVREDYLLGLYEAWGLVPPNYQNGRLDNSVENLTRTTVRDQLGVPLRKHVGFRY